MSTGLSGKVALVTGARHGIGAAIAIALAQRGATVVACGRNEGDCSAVAAQINRSGGVAIDHALNVSDLGIVKFRIDMVAARFGGLDVVVNNAATIDPMAPVGELDPLAFDNAMRTNVSGPAAIISAAWPHFRGGGRIVNILSSAALRPLHGWAAYCSSKAALLMLTRATDAEGTPKGIRCFGLAPGLVDTQMQAKIRAAHINQISDVPRSQLSSPSDAALVVAWLASAAGDDLGGTMADARDPELRRRAGLAEPMPR